MCACVCGGVCGCVQICMWAYLYTHTLNTNTSSHIHTSSYSCEHVFVFMTTTKWWVTLTLYYRRRVISPVYSVVCFIVSSPKSLTYFSTLASTSTIKDDVVSKLQLYVLILLKCPEPWDIWGSRISSEYLTSFATIGQTLKFLRLLV